jgi:hypothetical protein
MYAKNNNFLKEVTEIITVIEKIFVVNEMKKR